MPDPSNLGRPLFRTAMELFHRHWAGQPIRLVGITLGNLLPDRGIQLTLFEDREKEQKLAEAVDGIREKFGTRSIFLARSLSGASVFADRSEKIGGHLM